MRARPWVGAARFGGTRAGRRGWRPAAGDAATGSGTAEGEPAPWSPVAVAGPAPGAAVAAYESVGRAVAGAAAPRVREGVVARASAVSAAASAPAWVPESVRVWAPGWVPDSATGVGSASANRRPDRRPRPRCSSRPVRSRRRRRHRRPRAPVWRAATAARRPPVAARGEIRTEARRRASSQFGRTTPGIVPDSPDGGDLGAHRFDDLRKISSAPLSTTPPGPVSNAVKRPQRLRRQAMRQRELT